MSSNGRVLVTGGTGAFGIATTKWLTRAGHDVVVFARHEPPALPKGARFAAGDIRDAESVRRGMEGCDTVVHLAWALSGSITHAEAEPINIGGTRNVLEAMTGNRLPALGVRLFGDRLWRTRRSPAALDRA